MHTVQQLASTCAQLEARDCERECAVENSRPAVLFYEIWMLTLQVPFLPLSMKDAGVHDTWAIRGRML